METKGPQPNLLSPGCEDNRSNSDESDGVVASCEALLPQNESHHNRHTSGDGFHRQRNNLPKRPNQSSDLPVGLNRNSAMLDEVPSDGISSLRKYLSVFVLFLINLLNYMDRFTVVGVLLQIQEFFNISNASAGLLQTVFIISYMVVAPVFGYLGDRYNRKIVMLVGMIIWSGCTLFASFVNNPSHFVLFLGMRGLVGIGEASYSTIAPTIIADLFVKEKRTNMLSVFYFAIPVGSGLGYIVGSAAAKGFGSWHWALRITPGLGLVTMVLMLLVIPNTKRGASEADSDLVEKKETETKTSYKEDLIYIFKNKSFMSVTIGFTFMAFVVGSLTIWGPIFVAYSQVISGELQPCTDDACEYGNVSFVFGLITCVAGFMGVFIGAESAKRWKARGQKNADALVCAIGLISAAPLLLAGFQLATVNVIAAWTFIFLADLAQCLTWTLVGDMTLYVTMPSRRSTANSVQILTMHLLGDAGSPYLLGVMSDHITASMPATYYSKYIGLLHSMYVALFASVLGGCGFLIASLFIVRDKKKVDDALAGSLKSTSSSSPESSESSGTIELHHLSSDENLEKPLLCTAAADATEQYMEPVSKYDVAKPDCHFDDEVWKQVRVDSRQDPLSQNPLVNSEVTPHMDSPKSGSPGYISVIGASTHHQGSNPPKMLDSPINFPTKPDGGSDRSTSSSVTSAFGLLDAKETFLC